jgi:hypothetical protein
MLVPAIPANDTIATIVIGSRRESLENGSRPLAAQEETTSVHEMLVKVILT